MTAYKTQPMLMRTLDDDLFGHVPKLVTNSPLRKTPITVDQIKSAANPPVNNRQPFNNNQSNNTASSSTSSDDSSDDSSVDGGAANANVAHVRHINAKMSSNRECPPLSPKKRKHDDDEEEMATMSVDESRNKVARHSLKEFENGTKILRETREEVIKKVEEASNHCESLVSDQALIIKEQEKTINENKEVLANHDLLFTKLTNKEKSLLELRAQIREENDQLEALRTRVTKENLEWEEQKQRLITLFSQWQKK